MEVGLVAPFFSRHGADWDYFTIREGIEVVRVAEEDGSPVYTHTYLVNPSFTTCFTNATIDGRPGCAVSDLLEQHPEKPELHRVYGRKDDLIVLSSGFKACTASIYDTLVTLLNVLLYRWVPSLLVCFSRSVLALLTDRLIPRGSHQQKPFRRRCTGVRRGKDPSRGHHSAETRISSSLA